MTLGRPLAITAAGMATSVGRRRAAACAAIRAGIARPVHTGEIQVLDVESMEPAPLLAHTVRDVTEGFFRFARWLRLACDGLDDLRAGDGALAGDSGPWGATGLLLVTRRVDHEAAQLDEGSGESDVLAALRARFVEPLLAEGCLPIAPQEVEVIAEGSAGVALAVARAESLLTRGGRERVLVIAVDSWLDPLFLGQATEQQRLRLPAAAVGFVPGEAAVAFVLEDPLGARRHNERSLGSITALAIGREKEPPTDGRGGPALSDCVARVLTRVAPARFAGDVFVDLTGEEWRARQWGNALTTLGPGFGSARVHMPAVSLGDVGAASAAIGICLALEAHHRGWAGAPVALVASASDAGDAACIAVTGDRS